MSGVTIGKADWKQ